MNELKEIRERALVDVRNIVQKNSDRIREAYELVMRLSYQARSEGLLAIEYEVGRLPKDMPFCWEIGSMVRLVVGGMASEFVAEWMTLRFLSEGYQGLAAFLYFLYARGILMIQAGEAAYWYRPKNENGGRDSVYAIGAGKSVSAQHIRGSAQLDGSGMGRPVADKSFLRNRQGGSVFGREIAGVSVVSCE